MASSYGDWEVEHTISQGGQGQVFLVGKEGASGQYALKRFTNPERLKRHQDEVEAAMALDHPNIVEHIEHDLRGSKPYMVMEHCPGGTLKNLESDDWDTAELLRFFSIICDAVGHAHREGIVHRDLKPANIFLREDGSTPVVGDFGICFIGDGGERITLTNEAVGARRYTAPELEDGRASDVSYSADVYSLGKILYWLFEGRVFAREKHRDPEWSLTSSQRDLSDIELYERAFVNELLDNSVLPNPEERFFSARQFRAAVDRAIWRIDRHAQVTDPREVQICSFCGNGQYKHVGDTTSDDRNSIAEAERFGVNRRDRAEWMVLWCNNCGHVQHFRTDKLKSSPWKGREDDQ